MSEVVDIHIERLKREEGLSGSWSPRDALVKALYDVDAGYLNPEALIVVHDSEEGVGWYSGSTSEASSRTFSKSGLLHHVASLILK